MNLISVIIPVYNVENYLHKCIDSVINQTYLNLQIILIDDGSTDKSGLICDEYALRDHRIITIHQQNSGISAARNVGLDNADGDYITFVDADDCIQSEMYTKMYQSINNENADIAICNLMKFSKDEEIRGTMTSSTVSVELLSRDELLEHLTDNNSYPWIVVSWNKLYKRSIFNNERFTVSKINEDEYIMHRLFYKCRNAVHIMDTLYYYRQRENSIMSLISKGVTINTTRYNCRRDRIFFYIEKGVPDYITNKAIEQYINSIKADYLKCTEVKSKAELRALCRLKYRKTSEKGLIYKRVAQFVFVKLPFIYNCYYKVIILKGKSIKHAKNKRNYSG